MGTLPLAAYIAQSLKALGSTRREDALAPLALARPQFYGTLPPDKCVVNG